MLRTHSRTRSHRRPRTALGSSPSGPAFPLSPSPFDLTTRRHTSPRRHRAELPTPDDATGTGGGRLSGEGRRSGDEVRSARNGRGVVDRTIGSGYLARRGKRCSTEAGESRDRQRSDTRRVHATGEFSLFAILNKPSSPSRLHK